MPAASISNDFVVEFHILTWCALMKELFTCILLRLRYSWRVLTQFILKSSFFRWHIACVIMRRLREEWWCLHDRHRCRKKKEDPVLDWLAFCSFFLQLIKVTITLYITTTLHQLSTMSYPTNNQGEKVNPNLPGSYQPVMNQDNFNAPAHHLSTQQQEQVAELAEASSGHIHNTSLGQSGGNSGGFGSGSLGSKDGLHDETLKTIKRTK